jgi:serine/threonine-protein kinase
VANAVVDFDWTVDVRRERSDAVGVDEVIRTEPAARVELERGATLVVVLSDGPTLVALVDVVGLPAQEALAQLRELGLQATVTAARPDEEAPVDQVLRWFVVDQPALTVGAEVVKGTELALEVSQGPAPREVPDVVGSTAGQATATLEALGLVADLADDFSDTVPVGEVAAQRPLPGEVVARDSSVLVVVSKGPDVVTVPELDALGHDARLEALTAADLVPGTVTGDPTRRLLGLAVDGSPVRQGEQVRRGSTVSLVYELAP